MSVEHRGPDGMTAQQAWDAVREQGYATDKQRRDAVHAVETDVAKHVADHEARLLEQASPLLQRAADMNKSADEVVDELIAVVNRSGQAWTPQDAKQYEALTARSQQMESEMRVMAGRLDHAATHLADPLAALSKLQVKYPPLRGFYGVGSGLEYLDFMRQYAANAPAPGRWSVGGSYTPGVNEDSSTHMDGDR